MKEVQYEMVMKSMNVRQNPNKFQKRIYEIKICMIKEKLRISYSTPLIMHTLVQIHMYIILE